MRITYFRLKGYIKVLNGMGLNEIVIPFHEFKNRIVLIQGENGCAKSTIISALSPNQIHFVIMCLIVMIF